MDKAVNAVLRIDFHQEVDMFWHHFQFQKFSG